MKDKKLISTKELSEILGVHIQTIYNWVKEGMPRMKMGYNLVRYDLDEVMKWIENRGNGDESVEDKIWV